MRWSRIFGYIYKSLYPSCVLCPLSRKFIKICKKAQSSWKGRSPSPPLSLSISLSLSLSCEPKNNLFFLGYYMNKYEVESPFFQLVTFINQLVNCFIKIIHSES